MFSFIKQHKIITGAVTVAIVAGLATAGYQAYKESHPEYDMRRAKVTIT